MPPIRSQSSSNSTEQEGRLLLAIQAIKKQEIRTIAAAARTFNIPRSTLRDRLNGHTERSTKQKQKRTRSRRQIPTEEGLSVQEASTLITEPVEAIKAPPPPVGREGLRHLYSPGREHYQHAGWRLAYNGGSLTEYVRYTSFSCLNF
ncbi:Helix-turn-helix, Psq [Penicillium camemberti]|uniref:Helix-turn-helix, Psq n=1 Tax=Penicillium camemberti (strain FM 013) TaxID=1429867 RepID=A0A0G4PT24_PENC3|nr:Helix-turn-helix, Psq [Penicillium camemberti]